MGDRLQYKAVVDHKKALLGPVLEVGSKIYDGGVSFNFREIFKSEKYIGIDMLAGDGVDQVINLNDEFTTIDRRLGGIRFKTIICGSVLEHCSNPFKAAENMTKLLDVGGVIFISAPFVFQVHGYPNDYFRYTPNGLKVLFPTLNFDSIPGHFSSNDHLGDEIHPLEALPTYWIDFRTGKHKREKKWARFFESVLLKIFSVFGLFSNFTRHGYMFPVITINLFGVKDKA